MAQNQSGSDKPANQAIGNGSIMRDGTNSAPKYKGSASLDTKTDKQQNQRARPQSCIVTDKNVADFFSGTKVDQIAFKYHHGTKPPVFKERCIDDVESTHL